MLDIIPAFDWTRVFISPWSENADSFVWIALMGFFVTGACGLIGTFLLLRRMSLVGDAISHSVLPGLAIAFLLSSSRGSVAMFIGALVAAVVTTVIIEYIHSKTKIKRDSAISIAFTSLFAFGVIIISIFASKVDLDQDCVLHGEISFIPLETFVTLGAFELGPPSVIRMALVMLATAAIIYLFYKELLVSSFDSGLASSLGIRAGFVHYALMCWLSVVVVSAFEAVGAILVVAMLILPGAFASMLSRRLPVMLVLTLSHAALSSLLGIHLAIWLDSSMAAAMVVVGTLLFLVAWLLSPTQGIFRRLRRVEQTTTAATATL